MSLSLEEMQGKLASEPSADGSLSLDQMQSKLSAQEPPSKFQAAVGKASEAVAKTLKSTAGNVISYTASQAKQILGSYSATTNKYLDSLKGDLKANPEGMLDELEQSGKLVLDAVGAVMSPVEGTVNQGLVEPLQRAVKKVGGLVEKHAAAEDETWTAEERREAQRKGETLTTKYPKGIDWKVHQSDVRRTVKDLNIATDAAITVLTAMVGVGEARAVGKFAGLLPADLERDIRLPEVIQPRQSEVPKPRMRMVGQTASGKPILRPVTMEQASAAISQVMREVERAVRPVPLENPNTGTLSAMMNLNNLNKYMAGRYQIAKESARPIGAHALLDTISKGPGGQYYAQFAQTLRKYVEDVPVHFKDQLFSDGKAVDRLGQYDFTEHAVEINASSPGRMATTHAVFHELTHAATAKFLRENPNHALTLELRDLLDEVRARARGLGEDLPHGASYGIKDPTEFVAEAMSNPKFQHFLLTSKPTANSKFTNLFNSLASVVQRIFGITDPRQGQILHNVMQTTQRIMKAQNEATKLALGGEASKDAEIIAMEGERPITRGMLKAAQIAKKFPFVDQIEGKLAEWGQELIQRVNPEGLGPEAKLSAAVVASRMAERARNTLSFVTGSKIRSAFWNSNPAAATTFIKGFEKGIKFEDPAMQEMADSYRRWSDGILKQDIATGLIYEPRENYLYHVFNDSDQVNNFFTAKYGKKWGSPKFLKDRSFDLYEEAIAAGFKPKYSNPEEIMLARQLASDTANMQQGILEDLWGYGLAELKEKGGKIPEGATPRRAPNGEWYYVDNNAYQILHNAFDTKSLWEGKGIAQSAFRGGMFLKNAVVPFRLAFSLFHPLHVVHIDNAAMTANAWNKVLQGTSGVPKAFGETLKSLSLYRSLWENPKAGSRLTGLFSGKIPPSEWSKADEQAVQYMLDGGFVPGMSDLYRTNAVKSFRAAVAKGSATALWHAPWALMSTLQKPLFEVWIPNLKAASYLREAKGALEADPGLYESSAKRQLAFRRIAKSVDNRYGEMAYNTLFWDKWLKDLSVLNTLSLGWQLGFIREYGGGALDAGQFITGTNKIQKIREGQLSRPLFVSAYTTTALGYGGLMTWAMTGEPPKELKDYVLPRTGGTNVNGEANRVNTMFYTREFYSIYKHAQQQGVVDGLTEIVKSKASGVMGLMHDWWTGTDDFGREYRDPKSPLYKKVLRTLAYTMSDLEPISAESLSQHRAENHAKEIALTVAGFSPAPRYAMQTTTQAKITQAYGKYVAPKQTPYDRAEYSADYKSYREQVHAGEDGTEQLEKMKDKYQLKSDDIARLRKSARAETTPEVRMFTHIPWEEQKKLLDEMPAEEREIYLPHSNKKHLRRHYEEPEE